MADMQTPPEDDREKERDELRVLRALRDAAQEAHRERVRYTWVIVSAIGVVFLIRQFLPPAWMLWLP